MTDRYFALGTGDIGELPVRRHGNSRWLATDRNGLDDFLRLEIEDADIVAVLIGGESLVGTRWAQA